MLKLEGMETFVAIVQAGSISEAARRLSLSKSVVSGRLAELESRLGARLLHRSTRKLTLTEEGAAFYETAARISHELAEAAAAIAERMGDLVGPLRVAAPMTFGTMHVGPALYPFLTRHPRIDLLLDLNDRMIDIVGEGFDLAVRIGRLADSSLIARKLCRSRRAVVMSPAYAAEHGMPRTLADLEGHKAITYTNLRVYDEWLFVREGRTTRVRVKNTLQVNNGVVQREAVAAGLGIAILPTFITSKAVAEGRLVEARLDAAPIEDTVYAVYPPNLHLSTKVRALVDHLRKAFHDPPYWEAAMFGDRPTSA